MNRVLAINLWVFILMLACVGAFFIVFLSTMLLYQGQASIDKYHEGWFETAILGGIFLFALREFRKT